MSDIITVNASGLSCPQPVLMTKKALSNLTSGHVEVLVDTATSRNNVSRFAHIKAGTLKLKSATEAIKLFSKSNL